MLCMLAACRFGFDSLGGDDVTTGDGSLGSDAPRPTGDAVAIPPGAPAAIRDLCAVAQLTAIRGGYAPDDAMANGVAQALAATCTPAPATRNVSQDDPGVLDPMSDRPLLAIDDVGIVGGGDAFQRVLGYLLMSDTPLMVDETAARVRLYRRTDNLLVFDQPKSAFNMSHDFAMIMLTYEPIGQASVLSLAGYTSQGSLAAGQWFTSTALPSLASRTERWYILDWLDGNSDLTVNAGDTFTIVAMGP
jgi:hypothetical protein